MGNEGGFPFVWGFRHGVFVGVDICVADEDEYKERGER
jgi:hypothetical protein